MVAIEAVAAGAPRGYLATSLWEPIHCQLRRHLFATSYGLIWCVSQARHAGESYYRLLRDTRYADETVTDRGDEAIVDGYDAYQTDNQKDLLLFSNDRNFVECARSHRVLGQHVKLPSGSPDSMMGSWEEIARTLYVLTVLFGMVKINKIALFGVWKGKQGQAWSDDALDIKCRSPNERAPLERDAAILMSQKTDCLS